jgi:hypothetical protein
MDALDIMIRDQLAELEALRLQLAAQEAKVEALQQAAALRPIVSGRKSSPAKLGGKPRGAISSQWKEALRLMYASGSAPWHYAAIKATFDLANHKDLNLASVRDRVRSLVETGLMSGDAEHGFTVTELAAKKFGFERAKIADVSPVVEDEVGQPQPRRAFSVFDDDLDDEPPF